MKYKKTIAAVTLGSMAAIGAVSYYFFNYAIRREKPNAKKEVIDTNNPVVQKRKSFNEQHLPWYEKQKKEEFEIISFDGLRLKAIFIEANKPTNKTVIAIHGYKSNGEKEYMTYVKFYHDLGYNVLLPDDRAHGKSEGKYIGFGWLDRIDCIGWINYILNMYGPNHQIVLHGISMGSATVLMASGEHLPSNVKAIIADCGYTSAWDEFAYQLKHFEKLPVFPILHVSNLISKVLAGYDFKDASAINQVKKSTTPTLFIHGDQDDFVPTKMVNELYNACAAKKELVIIKEAGHALSHVYDEKQYHERVEMFLNKYVHN